MPHYNYSVFWSEEDDAYIAIVQGVPELRLVSAHGETPEEALHELTIALEAVETSYRQAGETMPTPEPLEV
jgi:predicted RNase H-like HicB family nuclease